MNYEDVKVKLEASKLELLKKIEDPKLTKAEKEIIQNSINNFDYIIELTDMNHFERGFAIY